MRRLTWPWVKYWVTKILTIKSKRNKAWQKASEEGVITIVRVQGVQVKRTQASCYTYHLLECLILILICSYSPKTSVYSSLFDPQSRTSCSSFFMVCCCLVAKPCLTLSWPHGLNPPGSSVHGVLQARILEWVGVSFSSGSSWPRD